MIFTLPPLPYAMDALEPAMSQETIEYHYGKHLQTYIDNLNRLTEGTQYSGLSLEELILTTTGPVFNNAAQVWNHTFFFNTLTPDPVEMPAELEFAITRDFGSVEEFKVKFICQRRLNQVIILSISLKLIFQMPYLFAQLLITHTQQKQHQFQLKILLLEDIVI